MIIWGSRTRNAQDGQGKFFCPKCEAERDYKHMKAKKYFTLYFIPLIPMGTTGEWWECQTCTRAYEPMKLEPKADAAALHG